MSPYGMDAAMPALASVHFGVLTTSSEPCRTRVCLVPVSGAELGLWPTVTIFPQNLRPFTTVLPSHTATLKRFRGWSNKGNETKHFVPPYSPSPSWGIDSSIFSNITSRTCDLCLLRRALLRDHLGPWPVSSAEWPSHASQIQGTDGTCLPPAGTFNAVFLTVCSSNIQLWQHIDFECVWECVKKKVLTFLLVQIINFLKELLNKMTFFF
jgi:hypothetical protein